MIDNDGDIKWITVDSEKLVTIKARKGRPQELFSLPKSSIVPLIQPDGALNLKIKFARESQLTASAQFLQSKLDQFEQR